MEVTDKIYSLLGFSAKSFKIVSGFDATLRDIKKVKLLIFSKDISEKTKKRFLNKIKNSEINLERLKIIDFGNSEKLSKSIGKNNKAIIGVKDINIANGIIKYLKEITNE